MRGQETRLEEGAARRSRAAAGRRASCPAGPAPAPARRQPQPRPRASPTDARVAGHAGEVLAQRRQAVAAGGVQGADEAQRGHGCRRGKACRGGQREAGGRRGHACRQRKLGGPVSPATAGPQGTGWPHPSNSPCLRAAGSGGVIMRASSAGTSVWAPRMPFTSSTRPCDALARAGGQHNRRGAGSTGALEHERHRASHEGSHSISPPPTAAAPAAQRTHLQRRAADLGRRVSRHLVPAPPAEQTVAGAGAHAARAPAPLLRRRLRHKGLLQAGDAAGGVKPHLLHSPRVDHARHLWREGGEGAAYVCVRREGGVRRRGAGAGAGGCRGGRERLEPNSRWRQATPCSPRHAAFSDE